MATKKKATKPTSDVQMPVEWPKVIRGSHSTRTEYEDGRVEFVTHWDELARDVRNALTEYENSLTLNKPKTKRRKKNEA